MRARWGRVRQIQGTVENQPAEEGSSSQSVPRLEEDAILGGSAESKRQQEKEQKGVRWSNTISVSCDVWDAEKETVRHFDFCAQHVRVLERFLFLMPSKWEPCEAIG